MKIKLKQAFDLQMGKTPARNQAENWGGNHRWVSIADIGNAEKYIAKTKECITDAGINASGIKVVPQGTVIMSFKLSIGKTAITAQDMYTNEAIIAFIDKKIFEIDPNYLYHLCCGTDWTAGTNKAVMGLTLNKATLLEKEISLPDICQQRKIAAKLDKIDAIIADRQQQLTMIEQAVKSRFIELFGDPVSNSYGLPEATLSDLGEFGRGVSKHRPRNDIKLLGGKYPLIQTGDVANAGLYITSYGNTYSELGLRQSKMWDKGTLCITIAANIAKTAILEFDACFPDSVVGFIANERTNNIFIHYWFSFFQEILESQAPESAQKNINLKILSELKVIVPEKRKQDEFASFVKLTDKSKYYSQKFLTLCRLAVNIYEQEWMKCQTLNF